MSNNMTAIVGRLGESAARSFLILSLFPLFACREAEAPTSLLGDATVRSDQELAQDRITIELRDLSGRHEEYWPTLEIDIAPTGMVTTKRGRFYPAPPRSLPPDTIQVAEQTDSAALTPERARQVRRELARIRPLHFGRTVGATPAETVPNCSLDVMDGASLIVIRFISPRSGRALFVLPDSCDETERQRVRDVVEAARALLPPSRAAAAFNY